MLMTPMPPTANAIAIVLARGGSKGLPRKNALPIAGRPCVTWTLDAAKAAATVGRVVLSTDDDELIEIGRRWEVEIARRPAELASDTATVDAAARQAVLALQNAPTSPTAPIVILYGNVPVRPAGLIDRAVELLVTTGCDSVQSYQPVGKYHPWWTARVSSETSKVRPWEGEVLNHGVFRRQDLPPAHIPDGGVIAVTRAALFHEVAGVTPAGAAPGPHAFFGLDRRGVINPEGSVVDIDTRIDMLVAEAMLQEE